VVLTFGRFLLLALLIGMIHGQGDHHDDLVPGQLWPAIQPLLASPPRRCGGRPRVDDHACLAGIVDRLRTGMAVRAG
jgi:hypothetical protein